MARWSQLRGAVIARLLSESGARAAGHLRRLRTGTSAVTAWLQLDDARSLLVAQVLRSWQRDGLDCQLSVVPAPDRAYDPEPERRRGNDEREAPLLAAAFGLRWHGHWRRPHLAALAAGHRELLAVPSVTVERFIEVAERLWGGGASAGATAAVHGQTAGEVALRLEVARRRLLRSGHFMAPVISINGDPYFGVMRLNDVADRLRELGHPVVPLTLDVAQGAQFAPIHSWPQRLTMFHSFRSPYSYLALQQVERLAQQYQLQLQIKPVLPMVMRGFAVPRSKRLFIVRDAARQARRHQLPFGRIADPLGPGIGYCMALFQYAAERGKAFGLCLSLGRGIWAQALDVQAPADLALMVERAGLSWSDAERVLRSDGWKAMAAHNREELLSLGLWGVPSFVAGEMMLWGQDRLPLLDAWLSAGAAQAAATRQAPATAPPPSR